jgi:hypothetical protein
MPKKLLVACPLSLLGLTMLRERFEVETADGRPAEACLLEHARGVAAIVADPAIPVGEALLDAAGGTLMVVANFGVGYDNIALEAVSARGVRATDTPDVLTRRNGGACRCADAGGRAADCRGRRGRGPRGTCRSRRRRGRVPSARRAAGASERGLGATYRICDPVTRDAMARLCAENVIAVIEGRNPPSAVI